MKTEIQKARTTNHWRGKANNDQRSFVELLFTGVGRDDLDPDESVSDSGNDTSNRHNCNNNKTPTGKLIIKVLGVAPSTGYKLLKTTKKQKEIMYGETTRFWLREKARHKYYQKVKKPVREKMDRWIREHHHVIHSPNYKDTVLTMDPNGKRTPKQKLLLQCTTDELLEDLYSNKYRLGDIVRTLNGKKLISKKMLGLLFPSYVFSAIGIMNSVVVNTVYRWTTFKMSLIVTEKISLNFFNQNTINCQIQRCHNKQSNLKRKTN